MNPVRQRDYNLRRNPGKEARRDSGEARHSRPAALLADAPGLSKVHNGTGHDSGTPNEQDSQKPIFKYYKGASLVEIEVPSFRAERKNREQKPRGKIKEWSKSSRTHLKRFLGTLKRAELGLTLIVTLTYPSEFPAPEDHDVYKYHLKKFTTYLTRKHPQTSGIWKLEFQSRGAAHYHLMLFGLRGEDLESLRQWVRDTWYKIAHNGDKHLGAAATQVDEIKSVGGATSYLVKYIAKGDQTLPDNFTGRYWGKINEELLPTAEEQTIELTKEEAIKIRRIARTKIRKDVEASMWKRFLKQQDKEYWKFGGRVFWEALKSMKHGNRNKLDKRGEYKPRWMNWMVFDGGNIEVDGEEYFLPFEYRQIPVPVDIIRKDIRRLPRRYKARNNDRLRLLCNADAFIEAIKRTNKPASSFLDFSSKYC